MFIYAVHIIFFPSGAIPTQQIGRGLAPLAPLPRSDGSAWGVFFEPESTLSKIPPEAQKAIIDRLEERGAQTPCPRCGNAHFSLLDGFVSFPLKADLRSPDGTFVAPSVGVACERCGFMSFHSLGNLDLIHLLGQQVKQGGAEQ